MMHERLSGVSDAGGAEFDEHLAECGRCRAHYRALLELARMATQIPQPNPPMAIRTRVAARLAPTPKSVPGDRRWAVVGIAAAACAVIILAVISPSTLQTAYGWTVGIGRSITGAGSSALAGVADSARVVFAPERLSSLGRVALGDVMPRIGVSVMLLVVVVLLLSAMNAILIRYARRAV